MTWESTDDEVATGAQQTSGVASPKLWSKQLAT